MTAATTRRPVSSCRPAAPRSSSSRRKTRPRADDRPERTPRGSRPRLALQRFEGRVILRRGLPLASSRGGVRMAGTVTSAFLYVDDVPKSIEFYNEIVGAEVSQIHVEK